MSLCIWQTNLPVTFQKIFIDASSSFRLSALVNTKNNTLHLLAGFTSGALLTDAYVCVHTEIHNMCGRGGIFSSLSKIMQACSFSLKISSQYLQNYNGGEGTVFYINIRCLGVKVLEDCFQ